MIQTVIYYWSSCYADLVFIVTVVCAVLSGLYSGGFDIEYPVNVGDWAIVVDAFVCHFHTYVIFVL